MSGDILVAITQGEVEDATGIYWEGAKDAVEHHKMQGTIFNNKKLSSLKW